MLESSSSSFSGEMMAKGGDNGIRTVERLRGRLLAERVASKAAKEEADLMAKRLYELEKQLAEEIKYRNRAEKRMKFALKKLKELKLLNLSESSAGSSESWKSDPGTLDSSGQCGSGGDVEEMRRVMGVKDDEENDGFDSSSGDSANQMVSQEGSWSSIGTAHSWSKEAPPLRDVDCSDKDREDSITDGARPASHDIDEQNNPLQEAEHSNDTLALVPASTALSSSASCSDVSSANAHDVLVALRLVKEQLRSSMERRRAAALSYPKRLYGQYSVSILLPKTFAMPPSSYS